MPRFFFHVRLVDHLIPDEEGTDLPDIDHARLEAGCAAREFLAAAIRRNDAIDDPRFEVADENGRPLFVFPFWDAVNLGRAGGRLA